MAHELLSPLLQHRIVVILRGVKPEEVVAVAETIAQAGGRFVEVPLNTGRALESIRIAARHFRGTGVHVGAGTVLTPADVDAVADAGGEYVISPNTDADVIRRTRGRGLLSMPGFMTPTEAFAALRAGADVLKCFPCGSPGNLAVLKSVIASPVFAVGGVGAANCREYLAVAEGVGVGMGIYRPGMPLAELAENARAFFKTAAP